MGKKVIAAGHICLDITPVFPKDNKKNIGEVLSPGKLIKMDGVTVSTGGSVANTGLGMKILGADVKLMGKVGDDEFGRMIMNILNEYNAGDDLIVSKDVPSSYSVVIAVPGTDRIFLHCSGANDAYFADDIPADELKDATLFHFGYPPLMRSIYVNQGQELLKIIKKAKDFGLATSLDMAMVDANSEAGQLDWECILKKVLPYVDFFVPSVEELCFMLDKERFNSWQEKAAGRDITEIITLEDIKPLARKCMEFGCKVLLIKCGAPGLFIKTASEDVLKDISPKLGLDTAKWADKEMFEKSYKPDAVLSGTGAGDTSIAAFLQSVLEGETPEGCIKLAAATGASCVTSYDALSGLKPLNELRKRIEAGWEKNS